MDYKVIVYGPTNTGKTEWIYTNVVGVIGNTSPTVGAEVHQKTYHTNHGDIEITFWDTAGRQEYRGLWDVYAVGAHGALIFGDTLEKAGLPENKRIAITEDDALVKLLRVMTEHDDLVLIDG